MLIRYSLIKENRYIIYMAFRVADDVSMAICFKPLAVAAVNKNNDGVR